MLRKIKAKLLSGDQRSVTVKKNALGSIAIKGISILISLMLVPLTLGYLSSELYGVWLTLSSIVVWLNFFDIGFTLGLKNRLTEAIALGDYAKGRQLVSTTYFLMCFIFIPLCLISQIFIGDINWAELLKVNEIYVTDIERTVRILLFCFCIQMIVNVFTTVVAAYQKVALSSFFGVLGQLISLLVVFLLTKFCPPSLVILSTALSLIPIVIIIVSSIILYSTRFKAVCPGLRFFNPHLIKDIFNLGYKFFLIQIQVVVLYQTTNILISNISGPEEVTAYNVAYRYLGVAMMVFQLVMNPLWPAFTDAYTKRDFIWMKRIYKKLCGFYVWTFIGILTMTLISPIIYHLWVGDMTHVPAIMTCVVAIYIAIHCWDTLQVTLIAGIGTIKLETYIIIVGLVGYLPLAYILGYAFGAIGIVLAMTIVNTIYSTVFTIQVNKILNRTAKGIWLK